MSVFELQVDRHCARKLCS